METLAAVAAPPGALHWFLPAAAVAIVVGLVATWVNGRRARRKDRP